MSRRRRRDLISQLIYYLLWLLLLIYVAKAFNILPDPEINIEAVILSIILAAILARERVLGKIEAEIENLKNRVASIEKTIENIRSTLGI